MWGVSLRLVVLLCASFSVIEAGANFVPPEDDLARYEKVLIPTSDGLALSGHVALPKAGTAPYPAVLLLAGSGAINRYGERPASATASGRPELLYRPLEEALLRSGVAVMMYDKRGVRPSNATFLMSQIDPQVMPTADAVRLAQDALRAFDLMGQHPQINGRRLGLLGHGEGGLLALKVAETRRSQVSVLFNFGVQTRSLGEILRYQYVERNMRLLTVADANFDGALDINEMRAFSERTRPSLFEIFRAADVDRDARLTEGEWRYYWAAELQTFLRHVWDDTLPWGAWAGPLPRNWFRQYLQEGNYLDRQVQFCDRTVIFHGEIDEHSPYEDALALRAACEIRRQPVRGFSYGGLGHGFSPRSGFRNWMNTLGAVDSRVAADLAREASVRLGTGSR